MEKIIIDDMIKALRCVASQDTVGDCYADHENFMHMHDKHKRIVCGTGEDLRDYISGNEAVGCPYHQNAYGCCFEDGELYWLKDVAELLEELKSYKGLEEQGLLVRLPCKVGDILYCIDNGIVETLIVNSFRIYKFNRVEIDFENASGFTLCTFAGELDEGYFLSREEAEKKLEAIKKND